MLQKIVLTSVVVLVLLVGCTCKKITGEDDQLSIPKTPYTGKQLRMDGYWYNDYANNTYREVYFFYNNGIAMSVGAFPIDETSKREQAFQTVEFYDRIKQNKLCWGVFQVDGDKITFERWYPSSGGPTHAYVRAGKILNDTTFQITESYRMQGGNKTEVSAKDEVYHFKKFSPKPDSVNVFVP